MKNTLFHAKAITAHLKAFEPPADLTAKHKLLEPWFKQHHSGELLKTDEVQLQGQFIHIFFEQILGYTSQTGGDGTSWTIRREENLASKGRRSADAAIGWYETGKDPVYYGVVELKRASKSLDAPDNKGMTPVEQAWDYASKSRTCRWVFVSNYIEFRLYHRGRSQLDVHSWTLEELEDESTFLEFCAILSQAQLMPEALGLESALDKLLEESDHAQKTITKKLYSEYKKIRVDLFNNLATIHPDREPVELVHLTQKLLDRVLFVAFAEDRGLMPAHTIDNALKPHDYSTAWQRLKTMFTWVDEGNQAKGFAEYNGGLFRPDPKLDSLKPSDEVLTPLGAIAAYDFSEDVSVEVLGHIFEQSITDLEELRALARGEEVQNESKRKKEGVFYTPGYITRYLVDRTLGQTLREKFDALLVEKGLDKKKGRKAERIELWRDYREWLKQISILDPACGSGAFLVAAFDHLYKEYERVNRALEELAGGGQRSLFDLTKTILNQNLFGVDLNAESIEISKLSLWLKTAEKNRKLTWLDANIVAGDSVVDDPEVSTSAFDWSVGRQVNATLLSDTEEDHEAVEKIWSGGFDVVVGNPPYVRQELLTDIKPHLEAHYEVWAGTADLFVYFFEQGLKVLKPGGRLGFIVANKWLKSGYAEPLRKMLGEKFEIEQIIDFGHAPIFPEADAFPCIIVIRKPNGLLDQERELSATIFPRAELGTSSIEEYVGEFEVSIAQTAMGPASWSLEPPEVRQLMAIMAQRGIPLEELVGVSPYRGVVTGRNDVFMIDEQTRTKIIQDDPGSVDIIKPYLRGRDISRWGGQAAPEYLIFTRRGIDISLYPGVLDYLEKHRAQLEPKPDDWDGTQSWAGRKSGPYQWYEIQDAVDYWEYFEKPKIVYQEIQFHSRYALDREGLYANNKVYLIPGEDLWLLAVLNSPLMWWHNWRYLVHMKDEALSPSTSKMKDLPIPSLPSGVEQEVTDLVEELITNTSENQEDTTTLHDWLSLTFGVEKLGNKLSSPQDITFQEFFDEVKKRRDKSIKLGSKQVKNLRDEYNLHQQAVSARNASNAHAQRRLSDLVFEAFGFDDEDIELVRRTLPPRTPVGM